MSKTNGDARQPLEQYDITRTDTHHDAYQLVLSRFPGLLRFAFSPAADFYLSSAQVRLSTVRVSTVTSSGHDVWLGDEERLAALIPIHGTIEISRSGEVRTAKPPEIIVVGTGERTTRLTPGYVGIKITFAVDEVLQRMQSLAQARIHSLLAGQGFPSSPLAESLRLYVHYLLNELDGSGELLNYPPAAQSASSLLIDLVASHWLVGEPHSDRPPLRPSTGQLRRAENFILANATLPISIGDVADAAGVSVRSLQLAFRNARGTTPRAFIANVRLHRIRALLEQAGPGATITEIASTSGITHLGRFARHYLLTFGELPSETLHRAQMRRG